MKFSNIVALSALVAGSQVAAHGTITLIKGANGVNMPGLTVVDGTPRGCASAACGAQKDTAIIRPGEMGSRASALGRTSYGAVDPRNVMNAFMGSNSKRRHAREFLNARQLLNEAASAITGPAGAVLNGIQDLVQATPLGPIVDNIQNVGNALGGAVPGMASGSVTPRGTMETGVQQHSGMGQSGGLPTVSSDGMITMIYHQVNQDGAGPLVAEIDPSSGGQDPSAFQKAKVVENVPGVAGFSTSSNSDFEIKVKMPEGMKCAGTIGSAKNVCVARVRNTAISGPFGGAAAFTQ
ncbi:cell surface protein Mas1 [Coccidioides immitis RS]|uniref:Cell surface protein Mas1 n=1 Tax=Coccidioides immitis (strain RS) TaxID=246410 RepID=A0A0E1RYZ7_COCIM|nr:cell surface protein Mas1 [Coccidioides immitis RS]EAS33666.2 cell surface protein Mas1 [Coccidioides immitis RS]